MNGAITAIILAGGKLEDSLQEVVPVKHKAWIPLGDRLMVEHVLDALEKCQRISRRILVADASDVPTSVRSRVNAVAAPGDSMLASVEQGLKALPASTSAVLAVPCDMPFIQSASIEDFLQRCEHRSADIWYSFVRREVSEQRYPGLRHTWVRLREGTFCGGGLVLFAPLVIPQARSLLDALTSARKNPWKLAHILGPKMIFKLFLRLLRVSDLEQRASLLLHARAVGIESPFADVGFNVDAAEELATARSLVEAKPLGTTC